MNDELKAKLRLKCAEVEGYNVDASEGFHWWMGFLPTYKTETDILRVVRLLGDRERENFLISLSELLDVCPSAPMLWPWHWVMTLIEATADQMREALAKVWGME